MYSWNWQVQALTLVAFAKIYPVKTSICKIFWLLFIHLILLLTRFSESSSSSYIIDRCIIVFDESKSILASNYTEGNVYINDMLMCINIVCETTIPNFGNGKNCYFPIFLQWQIINLCFWRRERETNEWKRFFLNSMLHKHYQKLNC